MVIGWWMLSVASAVQVRLAAEPSSLQEGQTGTVRLLIIAGGKGEPQYESNRAPALPVGEGLRVQFAQQSRQFQNINGRITQINEFDYRVTALDEGSWEIGPVELVLNDSSKITAQPVTLVVSPRVSIPGVEPEFSAEASFDDPEVYEGEVVLLHARYRSKMVGSQVSWTLPDLDGLHRPEHGRHIESSYAIEDPSGTIVVQELFLPLVAVATGKRDQGVVIASVQIPVGGPDIWGFRRMRHEQMASEKLTLTVRPLPPPPPGFSGLIGEFEVQSALQADKAVVGQSIPWYITVMGDGNLDGFELPTVTADGFSVYENDSQVTARIDGEKYRATAAFRRVVVPTREGELELPPLSLITFSPERGEYVTHTLATGKLTVVQGREGAGAIEVYGASSDPEADPVAIDLRAVYASGRSTAPRLDGVLPPLLGLAALPGLATFGILGAQAALAALRERRRRISDSVGPPTARSVLQTLSPTTDATERLVLLDVALRRIEGKAQTSREQSERLRKLRMRLGRVRFGDGSPDPTLEDDIRELVAEVEA
jgi:hypothetical protein